MRTFLAFLALIPLLTHAAEPSLSPREKADAFLTSLQGGDIAGAYDRLFVGSPIPQSKPQAVDLVKAQTQTALALYGKVLGHEFIKEEDFGAAIVRLVYVLKSEKAPLIWEFYFYKPDGSWRLANIQFNDQFNLLK